MIRYAPLILLAALIAPASALANGDSCVGLYEIKKFQKDGTGEWVKTALNPRPWRMTNQGPSVDPDDCAAGSTIADCAADLTENGAQTCFYPTRRPWKKVQVFVAGYTCPSMTQIRNQCGIDADRDGYINYTQVQYWFYDPDDTRTWYKGLCRGQDDEVPTWPECPAPIYE